MSRTKQRPQLFLVAIPSFSPDNESCLSWGPRTVPGVSMSFIAICPFCRRKVQAPDSTLGQSIACKKCKNNFTLAPDDYLPPVKTGDSAVSTVGAAKATSPVATTEPPPSTVETTEHSISATAPDTPRLQAPLRLAPVSAPPPPGQRVPWNPFGVAALLLGSVALLCASISWLQWATIPLAGAGLLSGVIALLATPIETQRDAIVLFLAGLLTLSVLAIALFWPAMLGLDNRLTRETQREPDPNRQMLQPRLDGRGVEPTAAARPLERNQWAQADQYDVEHGVVRLRILSATSHTVPVKQRKEGRPATELHVTVQVLHVGTKGAIAFSGWPTAEAPKLEDASGKSYSFQVRPENSAVARSLVPFQPVRDTLVFAAPPPVTDWVRLELPASAFGGLGEVRFQVPRTMIAAAKKN